MYFPSDLEKVALWFDWILLGPRDQNGFFTPLLLCTLNVGDKITAVFLLDAMCWMWGLDSTPKKYLVWYLLQSRRDKWNRIPALKELMVFFCVYWSSNQEFGTFIGNKRKSFSKAFIWQLRASVVACSCL